ncbi:ribokinase [Myceligenerans indicum]|uniref:Ribokinase n=1 Tax=Myceligenerans indicum TaxID=2593663 RepID=A0ABS1LG89_9MICO|nr:ribokinase [Myceligenerans indicum]MBL0885246.1 ribokinase [Myceligenerans indicum]
MTAKTSLDRWSERQGGVLAVLGSVNLDMVIRQPRLPRPGETIFGHRLDRVPGGKGLNQAIAAARAGGQVAFLGRVGDDDVGPRLVELLAGEGVDVARLIAEPGLPTGVAQVSVLDDGENAIVVAAGANDSADWSMHDERLLATATAVIAQLERPAELVRRAFRVARTRGVITVLTPAPVTPEARTLLALVDVLLLNENEAKELAGDLDATAAARELSRGSRLVVMTRGRGSTLVAHDGAVVHEEPTLPTRVVDTTGAGDCFAGTLVARLAAGEPLEVAIRSATTAASLCVSRDGASASMPFWSEVRAELGRRPDQPRS